MSDRGVAGRDFATAIVGVFLAPRLNCRRLNCIRVYYVHSYIQI